MRLDWGVRSRVLVVALLPMLVLAVLLTVFYTTARLSDIEEADGARGRAFARQLVAASEYAVFSGNHEALQQLTAAILTEDGVIGVSILGRSGETLASSGALDARIALPDGTLDTGHAMIRGTTQRIIEPIRATRVNIEDDLTRAALRFGTTADGGASTLGNVVLDLSRRHLAARRNELLLTGAATVLLVLVATLVLAVIMSRGVSGPIREVARTVERIGQGRFSERVPIVGGGSLRSLAEGVNDMAAELASMHADMHRRIEAATAELRERKDEAERANLAKSRFLAAASHDLRQPMHALGLFISELSLRDLDAPSARLLEQISASARAMEDLLDSLLDISRLDAGVLEPAHRPFALQPVLERVVAAQRTATQTHGVSLALRPTAAWALSDQVLFERIVANLVSNAVRYSPGGRVLVACRRRAARIRLEVRDSGIGIPQAAQSVIFQEFVQLANPERARGKGLGLGLAIVRRLTDLLGHPLSLRSAPGRGSVFAIEVPASTPAAAHDALEQSRLPGDLAGLRVAVLDDDPLALAAMKGLLRSWGCDVSAALELQTLLRLLAGHPRPPQIMISDFSLSGSETGIGSIRAVREAYGKDLPAALITGNTGADALGLAQRAGVPVLHKPVRPARLRALLTRVASDLS
ncbi:MAG TPA: hybrid sensor histidine kinase/response regulator [Rhodocyclaceae bacterium]|nr:hybrid sensor histidine kinase/response regulator [Rhodocyclaceae bacterium]